MMATVRVEAEAGTCATSSYCAGDCGDRDIIEDERDRNYNTSKETNGKRGRLVSETRQPQPRLERAQRGKMLELSQSGSVTTGVAIRISPDEKTL